MSHSRAYWRSATVIQRTSRLKTLVRKYPSIKDEAYVRVKLTGDGTRVSRSMHIIVIAFNVLCGDENPNSPSRNHAIAFYITYFFGADMKYLAICLGLQAANAEYFCIWCKCPKGERHITSKSWENELKKFKNKKGSKYGCIRQPLFPSIPVDHVIPDILHLFLIKDQWCFDKYGLRRLDGLENFRGAEFNCQHYSTATCAWSARKIA